MDTLTQLAAMLGVAATEVMGYYMQRAPLEWVDFYLSLLLLIPVAIGLCVTIHGYRKLPTDSYNAQEIRHTWIGAGSAIVVSAMLVFLFVGISEFTEAYKATRAPQAYAVDQILRALGGL